MAQRRYILLGLVAVLALVLTATMAVRQFSTTSAETATATMVLSVSGGDCAAQKCTVAEGAAFSLIVTAVSNADGHIGFQTQVNYSELVANGGSYNPTAQAGAEVTAPAAGGCGYPGIAVRSNLNDIVSHGATSGFPGGFSKCNTGGVYLTLAMTCSATPSSNDFVLVPYAEPANTTGAVFKSANDAAGNPNIPAKVTNVTVNCGEAPPPVTDTPTSEPPTNTPEGPTNTPTETPTTGPTMPPTATFTGAPPTNTPTPTQTRTPTNTPGSGCAQIGNGDVNGDGAITSVDSLWVLWDIADLVTTVMCPANEDANKNGTVNSIDSSLILQFVAGLVDSLPPN